MRTRGAEPLAHHRRRELARGVAIARDIARNDELPVEIGETGERLDENVVALARHHRADREQVDGVVGRLRDGGARASLPGNATVMASGGTP